jgi:hypothetical protein
MSSTARWKDGPSPDGPKKLPDPTYVCMFILMRGLRGVFSRHLPEIWPSHCGIWTFVSRSPLGPVSMTYTIGSSPRWKDGPAPDGPKQLPDPTYVIHTHSHLLTAPGSRVLCLVYSIANLCACARATILSSMYGSLSMVVEVYEALMLVLCSPLGPVSMTYTIGSSARWKDGPAPDGPKQLPDPRYARNYP